ncbi:RNA polymerase sigma factor [Robiginitomaculum antarcticum]|uniref:RNA polymerase sigma factor n=1 Tax=Robiginitomaculum antarcticum TaxID=437507 RepID=UPI0012EA405C|nr:sigma-70 family RNA polymerase sigma factor [Robiginitomaculum antarcticum]
MPKPPEITTMPVKVSIKDRRSMTVSPKSISAAKRDALWLAAIATHRDVKALTELFKIYGPKLKGWLMARGAGSGTAEDIVQDIMITCWTRAHMYDPAKASFATWVYRMTRNRWIDHRRKHGRMDIRDPELMKIIADDVVPSAEYNFIFKQDSTDLQERIDTLSDAQSSALRMAFMEYKTHQEISDEIGVPLGTVKTRIRSAIAALRKQMDAQPLT